MRSGDASGTGRAGGAGWQAEPLPEGVDWANRWAELQNSAAAAEAERGALQDELDDLRKSRVGEAMGQEAREESRGLEQLNLQLDEARRQTEARLSDVVAERARSAKISEELQQRVADLSRLSTEKLKLQYERNSAESALLLVREERDQLQHSRDEETSTIDELRRDLSEVTDDREKLLRDREDARRKFALELQVAHSEARHHRQSAEDAREALRLAREENAAVERRIREKTEQCAEERAALEKKLELRADQLSRIEALQSVTQKELAEMASDLKAARATADGCSGEAAELRQHNAGLEQQFRELASKHEELLCQHVPGAGTQSLAGFASVSELVQEAATARTQALQERQERQRLQEVLAEVEREVRARHPALVAQRDKLDRAQEAERHLSEQNEGLLATLQDLERSQRDSEIRAQQSQRSVRILEAHARDVAKQLAVLVHENRKLAGLSSSQLGGFEATALEDDRAAYRTVQDLADQNEMLRKKVALLADTGDTNAQKELAQLQFEQEKQMEEWSKHLADKAAQMKALVDTNERLAKERDAALELAAKGSGFAEPTLLAEPMLPSVAVPVQQRDFVPREHLAAVREEFTKCSEMLQHDAKEARASEFSVRQALASSQAQLEFEVSRKKDLEVDVKLAGQKLEQRKEQLEIKEKREASLEQSLRQEEAVKRDLEASLVRAKKNADELHSQVKAAQSKLDHIQQSNITLLAEKSANGQLIIDLQARLTQESALFKDMKRDLEDSFKREEGRLKEQVQHTEQRHSGARQRIEELDAQCTERKAEVGEARARQAEAEAQYARANAALAERTKQLEDLHASAGAHARYGIDAEVTEAEAQLERSRTAREKDPEVAKLKKELSFAEEMKQEHARSEERWKFLLGQHEKDLATSRASEAELHRQLRELREGQAKFDEKTDQAHKREFALEESARDLNREIEKLRALLAKKEEEFAEAKLEGEKQVHNANCRLEELQRQQGGNADDVDSWQRKHREAVSAHALDIELLQNLRERNESMEKELRETRSLFEQFRDEAERARAEKTDDAAGIQQRLARAEELSRSLEAENRKYQEHLLALSDQKAAGDGVTVGSAQDEAVQRIAGEMKCARELSEAKRQELELDRDRLQREVRALKDEAKSLQRRLDDEQQEALRLQAEVRREERAMAKMGQLSLLEDENRSLAAEVKSVEARLEEASSALDAKSSEMEPLNLRIRELVRKEEEADRGRQELEARADEWKRLYDEVVQKFDAFDVGAHKKLKDDYAKSQDLQQQFQRQVQKLQADLKNQGEQQKGLKAAAAEAEAMKKRSADFEKQLKETTAKVLQLTEEKAKITEQLKAQETEVKRSQDLRSLRDKMISDLNSKCKTVQEEHQAALAQAKAGARTASAAACAAATADSTARQKKLEDDLKLSQGRADKALSLAMDYQRVLEALAEARSREHVGREKAAEAGSSSQQGGVAGAGVSLGGAFGSGGGVTRAATTDNPKSAIGAGPASSGNPTSATGAGGAGAAGGAAASHGTFGFPPEPPKSATAASPAMPTSTGAVGSMGGVKRKAEVSSGASPSISETGVSASKQARVSGEAARAAMAEPTNPVPAKKLPVAKSMSQTQLSAPPTSTSADAPGTTFSSTPAGTTTTSGAEGSAGPAAALGTGAERAPVEAIDLELDEDAEAGAAEPPQYE